MYSDLLKLGMQQSKTKSLSVPNVPLRYFSDFVRGYFDADGNVWSGIVNKGRNASTLTLSTMFTSCSKNFLKTFWTKLGHFGIKGGCIYVSKKNYSRLQFSVCDSLKLYDIMYNQGGLGNNPLFLERKKVIFEKYRKIKFAAVV